MKIDELYAALIDAPTDMRAHLPVLRDNATNKHVVEMGTRRGISTIALLAGRPKSLTCYDLKRESDIDQIEGCAVEAGIPFSLVEGDLGILSKMEPPCEFLFIDAMHNGIDVAHYIDLGYWAGVMAIAMHDTEIFGRSGDLPGTPGILDAVEIFMSRNPSWKITYQTQADYGLTVIKAT